MDNEPTWQRQLLVGLGVLLVIGVLLGGIFAAIAVKAADYVGLGDNTSSNSNSNSSPNPILPTTGDATKTAPPPTKSSSPAPTKTKSRKPPRQRHTITLQASPSTVPSFGKINLSGSYPGHDGASLQVQRALGDGPWADFPISTSVSGDAYGTYIQTSMIGVNHIRMLDKATGKTSNAVTVTVG